MSELDIIDMEFNVDDEKNLVIHLNKCAIESLIEQLEFLRDSELKTSHVHIERYSGLEGNIESILIMQR